MTKDIYRNKKDFAREEIGEGMPDHRGQPTPREVKSQKSQVETFGTPGMGRKDKKVKMGRKLN